MRVNSIPGWSLSTLALFAMLCATPAAAEPGSRNAIAPQYERLLSISREQGQVRVIARLDVAPEVAGRRARISSALSNLRSRMDRLNALPLKEFERRPLAVYALSEAQLDDMLDSGLVAAVYEDRINEPHLAQSVPFVGGDIAHNFGLTGNGAVVAILDTGVDASHTAFGLRVVEEACFSTFFPIGSTPSTSLCPAGTTVNQQIGPGSAAPCDICDHGTHVASIAAGDDGAITGVAPQANVIAIQVFSRFSTQKVCGTGVTDCVAAYDSDIIEGLAHVESLASTYNIAAVNLSLGGGQFTGTCDATSPYTAPYADLRSLDIMPVASSGNNGYTNAVGSTSCVSTAIGVGSVHDTTGAINNWSNSSATLDMLAPGTPIYAALPNSGYGAKAGTSMAAPHVAGAFALLKGNDSSLTAAEMENTLKTYSVSLVDGRNGLTFPRLDIGQVTAFIAGPGELPSIAITAPANGATLAANTNPVDLIAAASDPQDGDLSGQVQWDSDLDGNLTSPASLSVGSHTLTATVEDSVGFEATDFVTVEVVNAPSVTITMPTGGESFLESESIQLSGTASDVEDGDISASIQWNSNLDGAIGSGASIAVTLSAGIHTLSATVTDSDGHSPTTVPTVQITVEADADADGLPDAWESFFGVDDPAADPDGDGLTTLQEYLLGTNPIDAAPQVTILLPADGHTAVESGSINLVANAVDVEDGNLSVSVQWSSDIDGALGTGASQLVFLSVGQHQVSATVTDSQGAAPVNVPAVTVNVYLDGDIDGDGDVDIKDLMMMQNAMVAGLVLSPSQMVRADLHPAGSGDGLLETPDLIALQQILLAP